MKKYIYISDSKVDELFDQIPKKFFSTRSWEIALEAFGLKVGTKVDKSEANRYARLTAVLNNLDKEGRISDLHGETRYFRGTMKMKWGYFEQSNFVYFSGRYEDTIVGLGGSLNHVLGASPPALVRSQWGSQAVGIRNTLVEELDIRPLARTLGTALKSSRNGVEELPEDVEQCDFVGEVHRYIQGQWDKLEFVSFRLCTGSFENFQVVLGTPLYVAYSL